MRTKSLKISKGTFTDVIADLMWVSQDTLDRKRLLTKEEYIEYARKIMDRLYVDYTSKAGM